MTTLSARSARSLVGRAIHDHGLLPMCVVKNGFVAYANAHLAGMFGCKAGLAGTRVSEMASVSEKAMLSAALESTLREGTRVHIHFRASRADGSEFKAQACATRVGSSRGGTVVMTISDVSAQERSMAELHSLAFADVLTGLPNRALFLDRLRITLLQARRQGGLFGIMLADLDGFKEVNDALGHAAGDAVLKTAADRFGGALRDSDTIARIGGDEFALILPHLGRRDDAGLLAGRIIRAMAEPMTAGSDPVCLGVSIGIATWPENGDDLDSLCLQADAAAYAAKRAGKGRYRFAESAGDAARIANCPLFEWSDRHLVGIPVIDEQHRHMTTLIERLGRGLRNGQEHDQLTALFQELAASAQAHFASEEALMDTHHYAHAERHRNSHRRLMEDVESLAVSTDSQSMVLIMRFLNDWMFVHIEAEDRPLAEHLAGSGPH